MGSLNCNKQQYYSVDEFISVSRETLKIKTVKNNKKETYINISSAFDIETTSFYSGQSEKQAIMYVWTFGIDDLICIGRTWEEFIKLLETLRAMFNISNEKRFVIYIHNLAYEFQFFCKLFEWEKIFSIRERKPIYARTTTGIEFRCSYLLSGYSLNELTNHIRTVNIKKLVGDLDYKKLRHFKTPLTENELAYCINDVRIVIAYINERMAIDGNITLIPMTKTGYVRQYCRRYCLYGNMKREDPISKNTYYRYKELMGRLTIDPNEYNQLKRAFQGGFTHGSAWKVQKILGNVGSFDISSSYPTVMIAEKFPMSKGELIEITNLDDFRHNLNCYCCLFDIEFTGLKDTTLIEHPISFSRCWGVEKPVVDNGRIVSAEKCCITLTEQDFLIIEQFYKWKSIAVKNFRRYRRGYLPRNFISAILNLYKDKTELKGVEGKEVDYAKSKEMINSCYGMTVTDICRPEILFDMGGWKEEKPDINMALEKYNKSKNRFLFYAWGVWVTAYARKNLFSGILEFSEDYVYSDTDSVKGLNPEKHLPFIESYNKMIVEKIESALLYHGLPVEMATPKTITGKIKPLGVWEYEGTYKLFKTLGAKRYMTYDGEKLNITVSGLNKKVVVPYLLEICNNDVNKAFNLFDDELYIPRGKTGKNTHTYIDEEMHGVITDYLGNTAEYFEASGVHMEEADYSLSMSAAYADYLLGINTYYE